MKYKLISPINSQFQPIEQVLVNRGIPHNEIHNYLFTTDADINSPLLLGEEVLTQIGRASCRERV